jgi:hypothetical protein
MAEAKVKRKRTGKGAGHRIMIVLPGDTRALLLRLQKQTGARYQSEVLRRGLELIRWVLEEREGGNEVCSRKPDGSYEVIKFV